MSGKPNFEVLPDRQADFPLSFSADGPWYFVVSVAAMIAIAALIWHRRRR
jgi:hypothetical protein